MFITKEDPVLLNCMFSSCQDTWYDLRDIQGEIELFMVNLGDPGSMLPLLLHTRTE